MSASNQKPLVAVACGGTGGHLFPGIAVAELLVQSGCDVLLLISQKDVDQQGVKSVQDMEVVALPAVGLTRTSALAFLKGFTTSFLQVRELFRRRPPQAVLAMGGFTSAPPVLAGKICGAVTFLHESNTIPGKANRLLSHVVDQAFVGFPSASKRLSTRSIISTGTPVRPQFEGLEPAACREALGLDPQRPVLLVMGGSQGASGINQLVKAALPQLTQRHPDLQYIHLSGSADVEGVKAAYRDYRCRSIAAPFLTEMDLALGAATIAISRAGASSLAELAATRVPAILIPYPFAADNHQFFNARALADRGAAMLLDQAQATPDKLAELVGRILENPTLYAEMREELVRWHAPQAPRQIAQRVLYLIGTFGFSGYDMPASQATAAVGAQ